MDDLGNLTTLRVLDVRYCYTMTDNGVMELASLTPLTRLSMCYYHEITDEHANNLGTLTILCNPGLNSCVKLENIEMRCLKVWTSLTKLNSCRAYWHQ